MHILYSMTDSGNCYKPRLLMAQLDIPFSHIEVSALDGTTKSDAYLAIAPAGQVPFLKLESGKGLAQSNAMLVYLAEGTPLIPTDKFERAKMFEWMFFEQYSHEPTIAVRRSCMVYPERAVGVTDEDKQKLLDKGHAALAVMEKHLAKNEWLAGSSYSIADIALYAYTHLAHQGGFDMQQFPAINKWLNAVKAQPKHVELNWMPADNRPFEDK